MKVEEIKPYSDSSVDEGAISENVRYLSDDEPKDKGVQVEKMFNSIAHRYDLMNSAMSLAQNKRWRNKALKESIKQLLPQKDPFNFLDVATGTGDVAFRLHHLIPDATITGIDLSDGMLEIAGKKLAGMKQKSQELIKFSKGDSLSLPFHNGEFNMVTVAYGLRNFADIRKGIREMRRVLKPNGILCIIELSTPTGPLSKKAYNFYSSKIIPWMGEKITGDRKAYTYLPQSIAACPQREDLESLLLEEGFTHVEWNSLTFGALTYYIAK